MLAPKSTHKRKRSSARSDRARKLGAARWIVNLIPPSSDQPSSPLSKRSRRLEALVDAHPFNCSLEIILPLLDSQFPPTDQTSSLPPRIQAFVDRVHHHASRYRSYRAHIPVSMLLDPIFVTAYLKTGSLIALTAPSGPAGLDSPPDDTVCLDGQGTLVLSLCKDTYQTLGLTGRASHFSRLSSGRAADRTSGPDSRFIVELPLLSPSFVPGKKGYQHALDRLRAWDLARTRKLAQEHTMAQTHASSSFQPANGSGETVTSDHATWDMLFVWSPPVHAADEILQADSSDSSAANEIRFPDHLVHPGQVQELRIHAPMPVVTESIWVPRLDDPTQHALSQQPWSTASPSEWQHFQDDLQEAVEWAGLASLGANAVRTYAKPDSTCVYAAPRSSQPGRTLKLTLAGTRDKPLLLSPLLIAYITRELDALVSELTSIGWATMTCAGFAQAPLTWRSKVPLSSVYGAKELPGNKAALSHRQSENEDVAMTDSSEGEEDDEGESDSSLDMGARVVRRKKRSKRSIGKDHTEHSFTPSTGETGWISFCLPPVAEVQRSRWVLVELVGTDTRS